ncbi:DMT family transporter [Paracoccus onubensis]|uniref:DMT family transporter n=1 Tax=Paracoccus onubensis TaxID=1675788 RepID=A0A418SLL8_9RHOB|nr:DMT family transporter [Paracoccus onubensis]RJE81845.1 DMT family transporter [Paracoccus onubensis]
MRLTGNAAGAMLQLAAMGLYATHDAIIKVLGESYHPFQILFFSSLLSFPLVSLILLQDPNPGTLRPNSPGWVVLRACCGITAGLCGFFAFSVLPLTQVYSILFTTPLLITILSIPLLGERVGLHRWGAILFGLIGVLIVLRPGAQTLEPGHFAAMLGAAASASVAVITRKLGRSERPLVLLMWPMLGNLFVTGTALSVTYQPMQLTDLALTGVIACLGLAGAFLVILAYRAGEAALVAPMQYSQILWATVYGWYLFSEMPDAATLIGAGVIIGSGLYIVWRESHGGNSDNRPAMVARLRTESVTTPKSTILQRIWRRRK